MGFRVLLSVLLHPLLCWLAACCSVCSTRGRCLGEVLLDWQDRDLAPTCPQGGVQVQYELSWCGSGDSHNPTVVCLECAFSPSLYPSPSLHCSARGSLSFLDLRGKLNCSSLIPFGRGPIYDIPSWIPCAGPTHTFALSSVDIQPVPRAALTFWLTTSDTTVNLGFFPRTSTSVLHPQGGF